MMQWWIILVCALLASAGVSGHGAFIRGSQGSFIRSAHGARDRGTPHFPIPDSHLMCFIAQPFSAGGVQTSRIIVTFDRDTLLPARVFPLVIPGPGGPPPPDRLGGAAETLLDVRRSEFTRTFRRWSLVDDRYVIASETDVTQSFEDIFHLMGIGAAFLPSADHTIEWSIPGGPLHIVPGYRYVALARLSPGQVENNGPHGSSRDICEVGGFLTFVADTEEPSNPAYGGYFNVRFLVGAAGVQSVDIFDGMWSHVFYNTTQDRADTLDIYTANIQETFFPNQLISRIIDPPADQYGFAPFGQGPLGDGLIGALGRIGFPETKKTLLATQGDVRGVLNLDGLHYWAVSPATGGWALSRGSIRPEATVQNRQLVVGTFPTFTRTISGLTVVDPVWGPVLLGAVPRNVLRGFV